MSATAVETAIKLAEQSFINGDIDTAIQYALTAMPPDDPELRWIDDDDWLAVFNYTTAYVIHKVFSLRKSWYSVLNIHDHSVDTITIKKAYKRLALRVHPDKNSSVAAETAFKIIKEALEVLSDPYKRKAHDLELQSRKHAFPPSSSEFTNHIRSWLTRFHETKEPVPECASKSRRSC